MRLSAPLARRKALRCEPGESYERSAIWSMARDKAAAYGQIRYALRRNTTGLSGPQGEDGAAPDNKEGNP